VKLAVERRPSVAEGRGGLLTASLQPSLRPRTARRSWRGGLGACRRARLATRRPPVRACRGGLPPPPTSLGASTPRRREMGQTRGCRKEGVVDRKAT